jgi:serine/threonine-protein kinase
MFLREARTAAQLRHRNIVSVYEVGREGDTVYIVSELVDGIDLSARLSKQRPSWRQSAQPVAEVADALQHAHGQEIVHRDLKPSNVMLDRSGAPHVMDFGLAKSDSSEIAMTADDYSPNKGILASGDDSEEIRI